MSWLVRILIVIFAAGFGALVGYLLNTVEGLKNSAGLAKCRIDNLHGVCDLLHARISALEERNDSENEVKTPDQK